MIIKQAPEDFIVKEIFDIPLGKGSYSYYVLKKTNLTTLAAIGIIAKKFRVAEKEMGFCGFKDKKAVTTQYISVRNGPQKSVSEKNFTLEYFGQGQERLTLGMHSGNYFEITVRECKKPEPKEWFINYFDDQRFGKNNAEIGKLIVQRKFADASMLIPEIQEFLSKNPSNFVGALQMLGKRRVRFYVHAYQSFLWNKYVASLFADGWKIGDLSFPLNEPEQAAIPLFGFGSQTDSSMEKFLEAEKISPRDFIIQQFPEASQEGSERQIVAKAKNVSIEYENGKCLLKFELGKGSYATMFIKQLFQSPHNS